MIKERIFMQGRGKFVELFREFYVNKLDDLWLVKHLQDESGSGKYPGEGGSLGVKTPISIENFFNFLEFFEKKKSFIPHPSIQNFFNPLPLEN